MEGEALAAHGARGLVGLRAPGAAVLDEERRTMDSILGSILMPATHEDWFWAMRTTIPLDALVNGGPGSPSVDANSLEWSGVKGAC